eukprot:9479476-Pyramimonas_sp.AAC.1
MGAMFRTGSPGSLYYPRTLHGLVGLLLVYVLFWVVQLLEGMGGTNEAEQEELCLPKGGRRGGRGVEKRNGATRAVPFQARRGQQ